MRSRQRAARTLIPHPAKCKAVPQISVGSAGGQPCSEPLRVSLCPTLPKPRGETVLQFGWEAEINFINAFYLTHSIQNTIISTCNRDKHLLMRSVMFFLYQVFEIQRVFCTCSTYPTSHLASAHWKSPTGPVAVVLDRAGLWERDLCP